MKNILNKFRRRLIREGEYIRRKAAGAAYGPRRRLIRASEYILRWLANKYNYSLVARHYYSPIPDEADFPPGFWEQTSALAGIDMNDEYSLELLRTVLPAYIQEFRDRFPIHQPAHGKGFWLINSVYMAVDAHIYYSLIRHFKPRRIIEIGSGQSTILAAAAAAANREADGVPCQITAIEPFPARNIEDVLDAITLIEKPLQAVELSLFDQLEAGDILFIDSTHVLREGNDVQLEYLDILPRLKPGVLVHVHDISLPRRYPKVYFDQGLYWNEQYLLQAYLVHNSRMKIIWAGNNLMLKYPQIMCQAFPEFAIMREKFPLSEPSAFWMQVESTRN